MKTEKYQTFRSIMITTVLCIFTLLTLFAMVSTTIPGVQIIMAVVLLSLFSFIGVYALKRLQMDLQ